MTDASEGNRSTTALPTMPDPDEQGTEYPTGGSSTTRPGLDEQRVAAMLLIGALVMLAAAWVYIRRGQFFDPLDIDVFAVYQGGDVFRPYHGHLSLIPAGIYKVWMAVFGISNPWPYTVLSLVTYGSIAVAMFLTHRRIVDPLVAAIVSVAAIWSWSAQDAIRFNFMINFYLPALMLLIAWALIRRDTRRDDALSVAAVTVALASSGVGLVAVVAVIAELSLRRHFRRASWYLPPILLWLVWYLATRHDSRAASTSLEWGLFGYAWEVVVSILSGFTIGWRPGAVITTVALVVLCVRAHRRWQTVDAHVIGTFIALAAFVVLVTLSRAEESKMTKAFSPRYIWFGDLLLLVIVLGCLRGRPVDRRGLAALAAAGLVGAAAMLFGLRANRAWLFESSFAVIPNLRIVEAAGPLMDPAKSLQYGDATAGDYQALVRRYGAPAKLMGLTDRGYMIARVIHDGRLIRAEGIDVDRVTVRPACSTTWRPLGSADQRHGVEIPPGSTVVVTPAFGERSWIRLWRFAVNSDGSWLRRGSPDDLVVLGLPVDSSTAPWHVRVKPGSTADVCIPADPRRPTD